MSASNTPSSCSSRRCHGRHGLVLLLIVGLVAGLFVFNSQGQAADDETPLAAAMGKLNDAYKLLKRQARRLSFDDTSVQLAIDAQTHSLVAMHETPAMTAKLPADQRKAFELKYRQMMAKQMTQLFELEFALLQDQKEKAKEILDGLGDLKSDGHDAFIEEDE